MTLDRLIEIFGQEVAQLLAEKITGQFTFIVNLSQGGIGRCKTRIERFKE